MKPNFTDYLKSAVVTILEVIGVLLVMLLIIAAIFLIGGYPIIFAKLVLVGLIIMTVVQVCQDFFEKASGYAHERHEKENPSDEA